MSDSPLQHKTIRPGTLSGYSYYYSGHRPPANRSPSKTTPKSLTRQLKAFLVIMLVLAVGVVSFTQQSHKAVQESRVRATAGSSVTNSPKTQLVSQPVNNCADNRLEKLVIVSISRRHLWACQNHKTVQDSPVITGMLGQADTLTPSGSYRVYAKQANTILQGTDSTGSWSDPVSYWMPFLNNQHGTYGFHDATWRPADIFGKIDPASNQASHGCVELPIATSRWLYNWVLVGTTVTIEN